MNVISQTNDNNVGEGCTSTQPLRLPKTFNFRLKNEQHTNNGTKNNQNSKLRRESTNPSIWTTNTSRSSSNSNFTTASNDFHFVQASDIDNSKGIDVQNGSTTKLLPHADNQSSNQV